MLLSLGQFSLIGRKHLLLALFTVWGIEKYVIMVTSLCFVQSHNIVCFILAYWLVKYCEVSQHHF